MRLTAEQKRNIEQALLDAHDALFAIKEQTGLSVSVSAYGNDAAYCCIFIHTPQGVVMIDERSKIKRFFNSAEWRNRGKE